MVTATDIGIRARAPSYEQAEATVKNARFEIAELEAKIRNSSSNMKGSFMMAVLAAAVAVGGAYVSYDALSVTEEGKPERVQLLHQKAKDDCLTRVGKGQISSSEVGTCEKMTYVDVWKDYAAEREVGAVASGLGALGCLALVFSFAKRGAASGSVAREQKEALVEAKQKLEKAKDIAWDSIAVN